MKVDIYGTTASTISCTTLNLTLRGNDGSYVSIAKNIIVENEHQRNELNQLKQLGLIKIVVVEEDVVKKEIPHDFFSSVVEDTVGPEVKTDDKPVVERSNEVRDKRSKNKSIKRKEGAPEDQTDSEVVIMTETGPVGGKMSNKANREVVGSEEKYQETLEAARLLDEAEKAEDDVIDDSSLDPSERMGEKAIIGSGSGKQEAVAMQNSAMGNKAKPHFIDLEDEPEVKAECEVKTKGVLDDLFASEDNEAYASMEEDSVAEVVEIDESENPFIEM